MATGAGTGQGARHVRWLVAGSLVCAALVGGTAMASAERWRIDHREGTLFSTVVSPDGDDVAAASVAISREWAPEPVDEVLVARDDLFADTLASGARQMDTPLLLTASDALDPLIGEELTRLAPARITVLGGTEAISEEVFGALQDHASQVTRLAGGSRVDTSIAIADATWPQADSAIVVRAFGPDPTTSVVDSLSAGAAAAATGQPVLLTPTDGLTDALVSYLARGIAVVTIVGGTEAVSDDVRQEIEDLGISVRRVSGSERHATAVAVATELFDAPSAAAVDRVVIADGVTDHAWASGLAMAGSAAHRGAPVLLTNGAPTPPEPTAEWLSDGGRELVCAPFVPDRACDGIADPPPVTVRGTTVDAATGQPLDGARIRVVRGEDPPIRTTSDDHGRFELAAPVGGVVMTAAHAGYEPATATRTLVYGHDVSVELRLDPHPGGDEIVLITGAEGTPLFEEPAMSPGEATQRTLTITNEGLPSSVRLYATGGGDLAPHLEVLIEEIGAGGVIVELFHGTLAELVDRHDSFPNGVGNWRAARGARLDYRITTTLSRGLDDGLQGASADAVLWWEARG